jgi:DNA polymerase II large subunit
MEGTSSDSDRMFLLSPHPAMKELSTLENMDFRVEVQVTLQQKLRRPAADNVSKHVMSFPFCIIGLQ